MKIEYPCLENALSDDGAKKCINSEWKILNESEIDKGKQLDNPIIINSSGETKEDRVTSYDKNRFYKINLEGPSKISLDLNHECQDNDFKGLDMFVLGSDGSNKKTFRAKKCGMEVSYDTAKGGEFFIQIEHYSEDLDYSLKINYVCIDGVFSKDGLKICQVGVWVGLTDDGEPGEIIIPIDGGDGEISEADCPGCLIGGKCYTFGYRKSGNYCSEEGLVEELGKGEVCENHFECSSNLCLDSTCVSQGVIKKFLNWLGGLFG